MLRFVNVCMLFPFLPAHFAGAVTYQRPMKRIVCAIPSPLVGGAFGRRGSFSVHKWEFVDWLFTPGEDVAAHDIL